MDYNQRQNAVLLLQDGTMYHGKAIGKIGTTGGEICFNTGMTGYQEIYTDPSYFGQIIVNTCSHIGNYGTVDQEIESDRVMISGLVVKQFSSLFSRKTSVTSLQDYLVRAGITGISDIDTRALVRHIREKGAMNAVISSENPDPGFLKEKLAEVPDMTGLELSSKVSCKEPYLVGDPDASLFKVAVLDLGIKKNILRSLTSRGCLCKVFPCHTTYEEMKAWQPHGFFISNGPGDPASTGYAVETVRKVLLHNEPLFGICLGHQLLGLACHIPTFKMHHGHRGLNHPVKNLITGRAEITSQNHGFSIDPKALANNPAVEVTHINLNDHSIEGIRLKNKKAFSVQYHPESSPGPHDSRYLFDQFIEFLRETSMVAV
jgi:carbamoyl-phosphate synthase small subunit